MKQDRVIKKSSRAGRYRKQLTPLSALEPIAQTLEQVFHKLDALRLQKKISDAEFLSMGLLILLACRRKDAFQKSGLSITANQNISIGSFTCNDFKEFIHTYELPVHSLITLLELSPQNEISSLIKAIRFRGVPESSRLALLHYLEGQYPLQLYFFIPTIEEVFSMQKQGRRCVTFFKTKNEILQLYHGRDVVSFIIHDLMHAHEFYDNRKMAQQQIGFYHFLDKALHTSEITNLYESNKDFQTKLQYIMSDMNSYCGHLIKTLHAAVILHSPQNSGNEIWEKISQKVCNQPNEQNLLRRVNTDNWTNDDFVKFENIMDTYFQNAEIITFQ